ncbi:hypothetical protein RUND412_003787 [Rhizina undulata]
MTDLPLPVGLVPISEAVSGAGKYVNVVGVVADFLPPMKSKGTDWTVSFTICDESCPHLSTSLMIRIFKAQNHLPDIKANGDVILIRNLNITNFGGQQVGISHITTTWIVSNTSSQPSHATISTFPPTLQPPQFELDYIRYLSSWWTNLDQAAGSHGIVTASYKPAEAALNRKRKFSLIEDMKIDCFYDIIGYVVKTFPGNGHFSLYIADYTSNTMLHCYEWGMREGQSGVGREDDDYDYTGRDRGGGGSTWGGPFGQYTLQVTLWDAHATAAENSIHEGMFISLKNVRAKLSKNGKLEGVLHGDRKFPQRVDFEIIRNLEDPRLKSIIQRQQEYTRRFKSERAKYEKEAKDKLAKKTKREKEGIENQRATCEKEMEDELAEERIESQRSTYEKEMEDELAEERVESQRSTYEKEMEDELAEKKQWEKEIIESQRTTYEKEMKDKLAKKKEREKERIESQRSTHEKEIEDELAEERIEIHRSIYETEMEDERVENKKREKERIQLEQAGPARDVVCTRAASEPINLIGDIVHIADSDKPFSDKRYHIYCRIIDYIPRNLEYFSKLRDEDLLENDNAHGEWVWRFAFLLQSQDDVVLRVIVKGEDADYFLKINAADLRKTHKTLVSLRERLRLLWGNLEEQTQQKLARLIGQKNSGKRTRYNHSDGNHPKQLRSEVEYDEMGKRAQFPPSGRLFRASVMEYGVRSSDGKGWQRMFKLFGTTIR